MTHNSKAGEENEFYRLISKLELSPEFSRWHEKNTVAFLSYIFMMFDEANTGTYQAGYYNPDLDEITTFIIDSEAGVAGINTTKGNDILKAEPSILKLEIKKVACSSQQILDIAKKFQQEKYSRFKTFKSFVILQNLSTGQIFNFTFLSISETLNIRISSDDGKIVGADLKTLMNIAK